MTAPVPTRPGTRRTYPPERSQAPSERSSLSWVESEGSAVDLGADSAVDFSLAATTKKWVARISNLRRGAKPPAAVSLLTVANTFYKAFLSPIIHSAGVAANCRFQPTCSEYATLALAQHGPIRGIWLTITRLLRCHPFARGGWDPVPLTPAPPARKS